MSITKIWCWCGVALAVPDNWTVAQCGVCHATHYPLASGADDGPAPADQTGSIPAGEAAQAEVRALAERMTVLEGRVDELCCALRAVKVMPAAEWPAAPAKGYWR